MKKIASILLVIVMLAASIPFTVSAATSYTQTIDAYNSTRYTDYLVIYNKSGTSTGTNPYGYEVVVTNGIVTAVGGSDSLIPAGDNSFVASGHGVKSDWLSNYVMLGMKATVNTTTNKITFTKDNSTLITALGLFRDQALTAKQRATEACIVYDSTADSKLESAEVTYKQLLNNYNNNGTAPSQSSYNTLSALYTSIASLYTENAVTEYRGAWVRPTQTSYSEVEAYVKKAYDAGLNMLSVETLYNSTTIYPTPSGSLLEHNPAFGNFDVLDAYIKACHKYDMELHVWMPVFYSGGNGNANWKRSVAYKKPSWRLISQKGLYLDQSETYGLVFLNPALPEVQDFLLETYEYILTNYDIDGFQLDYIRYRDRTGTDDFGYDDYTIAAFKEAYPKYANYSITYNTDAAYWNSWVTFRASNVTKMVERVRALVDRVAPEVMLTADVGPSVNEAANSLYQDYKTWLANNWLDMIHPMAYGNDYSPFMVDFQEWADESCLVVPGLGTYMEEFNADDMVRQTRDMLNVGCDGVVYFELSAFFSKGCGSKLTSSLFTEKAIAPHLDINETFNANLDRLSERVAKATAAGNVSSSLKNSINALITEAKQAATPLEALEELEQLLTVIEDISSEPLYNRIKEDLVRAAQTCARELRDYRYLYEKWEDNIVSFSDTEIYVVLGQGEAVPSIDELKSLLVKGVVKKGYSIIESNKGVGTEYVLTNGFANIKFIVKGDINGDGKVSSMDYVLLKRQVMRTIELTDIQKIAGNVNKPERDKLDTLDYTLVKRHVLKSYNIYA